jgi:hypothetical protein
MGVSRVLSVALFLFLTVSVVDAYTIVMRDGRRVEIPNEFTVTGSTLTYEVSNGFQVTVQLNTVDIPATERANGEAQGAFLRKANTPKPVVERAAQTPRPTPQRSITNAELEKYRRARIENEDQRKALGLPSLQERQKEVAAIEDRTMEQVRNMRAQEEAYWRSRAEALRAETEANRMQFESLRQRPEEIAWPYSLGEFPAFGSFDTAGFGIAGGRFNGFRRFGSSPFGPVFSTPIPTPFSGFLATPITPFPTFPFRPVFRGRLFVGPRGLHSNPRPIHPGRGSHR